MESIVAIVGFLGAGKTTLLLRLVEDFVAAGHAPYVVLNDYADANLDAQRIAREHARATVTALTGSCICCDGINELRASVNEIPAREGGVTLIEANGTSDAGTLMGFLGVGLDARFRPPVQVSVVDVRNWQQRGPLNTLEAEQVKVASLIVLSHTDQVEDRRRAEVESEVRSINPLAGLVNRAGLDAVLLTELEAVERTPSTLVHEHTHWSSCSVDLPDLPANDSILRLCEAIPASILRIKGCTRVGTDDGYTYFERCPDGEVYVRPYAGTPVTGPKLLTVGPGSEPEQLREIVARELARPRATGTG